MWYNSIYKARCLIVLNELLSLNSIVSQLFGFSVLGGIVVIIKFIIAFMKRLKESNLATKEAVKSLLHNAIYTECNTYINRGYIYSDEFKNLHYLYSSYIALGGNGAIIELFEKVKDLDWKGENNHAN